MKKLRLSVLFVLYSIIVSSSDGYQFRIKLTDKKDTPYSIDKPEEYLSKKTIERRQKQNIVIDSTDLPISTKYETEIERLGFKIVVKSKWLNTLTVECKDSLEIVKLKDTPFIKNITWVGKTEKKESKENKKLKEYPTQKELNYYGYAKDQIFTINGQKLHEKGYKGKGIDIAIIDAGYKNLKENLYLSTVSIGGYKDFVNNDTDMFSASEHGINVLSAMATNQPNRFVGTAPEATYWLLRAENDKSEYPVEEDYWVNAIEYADSIGADVVNSSLGYQKFDFPATSISYEEMDGKTLFITKAAQKATEKGIFLVISAGNEGKGDWGKITAPADTEDALVVGSMSKDSVISWFSSSGPTYDGRFKPDIVAMGEKINLIDGSGSIVVNNGTSFSTPIITGLTACLWQAFPNLTNIELLNIIRDSGNKRNSPNERYGYGIPDMLFAFQLAGDITTGIEEDSLEEKENLFTYSSDSIGNIKITKKNIDNNETYIVKIYDLSGKIFTSETIQKENFYYNTNISLKQPYIIYIIGKSHSETKKIIF